MTASPKQLTTTRAFAYLRVSGLAQLEGDGFTRQIKAIETYAGAHSMEIVEVLREEGVSGAKDLGDRPALSELLAALEENGVKTVIVERLDRIARDLMIQETIVADMIRRGYTLISCAEPDLCSSDPSRVLIRHIFGAISQWEKAVIVMKLQAARKRIAARDGKCGGRAAFGEKSEAERAILARMRSLRESGMIYADIAAQLNQEGVPARMGGAWTIGAVAKILSR